ncbi:MAG: glycosyltransferase [Acidimicrobiia bacterium]|nr:glycosyltransferase [Acidimicrobiia bacterium]MDH5238211.1 glycosyltransferase [Acidimicrobiia bacterium]
MTLRVLHVAESFSAGVATAIEGYIDHSPDHLSHVVYGFRRPGIQVAERFDTFTLHDLPGDKVPLARAIRTAVHEEQPDVVHLHSSWAGILGRVSMPRGFPVVFTPHCFAFERRDISAPTRSAFRVAETVLASRTDVFATCSHHEMAAAGRFPTVGGSPEVIHLPYVLPHRASAQMGALRDRRPSGPVAEPVIVGSGRLGSQKGSDFFVEVVRESAKHPSLRGVRWRWVGGGDEALARELTEAGVSVTGWIDRSDVLDRLAASDVYLHTAAWEGFPLTVLEAAAMGLPVIAREIAPLRQAEGLLLGERPEDVADHLELVVKALRAGLAPPGDVLDLTVDSDEYAELLGRIYQLAVSRRATRRAE